jgi:hypothetical protein
MHLGFLGWLKEGVVREGCPIHVRLLPMRSFLIWGDSVLLPALSGFQTGLKRCCGC